jgi:hypothetical protein
MDLHVWWSLKEVYVPVLVYFFLSVDIEVLVGIDRDQHLSDVCLRTKKEKISISRPQRFVVSICPNFIFKASDNTRPWPWAKREHGVFATVYVYCRFLLIAHCQGDKLTDVSERAVLNAEVSEVRCCMNYTVTKTVPNCDWPRISQLLEWYNHICGSYWSQMGIRPYQIIINAAGIGIWCS